MTASTAGTLQGKKGGEKDTPPRPEVPCRSWVHTRVACRKPVREDAKEGHCENSHWHNTCPLRARGLCPVVSETFLAKDHKILCNKRTTQEDFPKFKGRSKPTVAEDQNVGCKETA